MNCKKVLIHKKKWHQRRNYIRKYSKLPLHDSGLSPIKTKLSRSLPPLHACSPPPPPPPRDSSTPTPPTRRIESATAVAHVLRDLRGGVERPAVAARWSWRLLFLALVPTRSVLLVGQPRQELVAHHLFFDRTVFEHPFGQWKRATGPLPPAPNPCSFGPDHPDAVATASMPAQRARPGPSRLRRSRRRRCC